MCIRDSIISAKCHVPELYHFELLGTQKDIAAVKQGLQKFWKQQKQLTKTPH